MNVNRRELLKTIGAGALLAAIVATIGLGISPKRAKSRYRIQLRAYTPQ